MEKRRDDDPGRPQSGDVKFEQIEKILSGQKQSLPREVVELVEDKADRQEKRLIVEQFKELQKGLPRRP